MTADSAKSMELSRGIIDLLLLFSKAIHTTWSVLASHEPKKQRRTSCMNDIEAKSVMRGSHLV